MNRLEIEQRTILLGLSGSQAYGTYLPTSDTEYKGICIGSKDIYLGFHNFEQKDKGWESEEGLFKELDQAPDSCIYELKKYLNLATSNNPNILEMLWLEPDQYLYLDQVGQTLINNRQLFLSKKVKHSFAGYAYSQIKRIENHRNWLLNPPKAKPQLSEFCLEENTVLNKGEINTFLEFLYLLVRDRIEWMEPAEDLRLLLLERLDYKATLKSHPVPQHLTPYVQEMTRGSNDFIKLLHSSQAYRQALRDWEAYQSWKTNRNPARATLEAKCGFDGKHA